MRVVALAIAAVLALSGCAPSLSTPRAAPTEAVVVAPDPGAALPVEDFETAIAESGTVVVDVRAEQEYAAGHLPGAINVDVRQPDFAERITYLDDSVPYAVYSAEDTLSEAAVAQMREAGFAEVFRLDGGVKAWTQSGRELTVQR